MEKDPVIERTEEDEGQLTVDVYHTSEAIIIESTIAGVNAHDLDIDVTSESVTIRGERKRTDPIPDDNYYFQECFWGKFSRSIILPEEVDPARADAEIKNGILKVVLPKVQKVHSQKIKAKTVGRPHEEHIDTAEQG